MRPINAFVPPPPRAARTDRQGVFRLVGAADPALPLWAYKPGYDFDATKPVHGRDPSPQLVLVELPTVSGEVVDEQGKPIAEFKVSGQPFHSPEGKFRTVVGEPASKQVALEIAAEGFVATNVSVEVVARDNRVPRVVLHPAVHLRGRVVDAGTGAGVKATLQLYDPNQHGYGGGYTLADGTFDVIAAAGQKALPVRVMPHGNVYAEQLLHVDPSQPLEVRVQRWAHLKGTVRDAHGKAVHQGLVLLEARDGESRLPACWVNGSTYTDAQGAFVCAKLAPGHYRLSVENRLETEQELVLRPEEDRVVEIQLGP
jgi:hypothetical protein